MAWILSSWKKETLWFYLPGLVAILISFLFPMSTPSSTAFLIYAFIAKEFIDSGHVYTTIWRTYLDPQERGRFKMYIYAPLIILLFFSGWIYFQIPFLGAFIVYMTLFHNCRQFFGMSKWYQRLNHKYRRTSDWFLYLNCFLPIIIAHFRTGYLWNSYYTKADLPLYPNEFIYKILLAVYGCVIILWAGYELRLILKKQLELNRVLSVAFPSVLYGVAFLVGRTPAEILFPLVVSHGISYFAMTSLALTRKQVSIFKTFSGAAMIIIFTALIFGGFEGWLQENATLDLTNPALALFMGLYLTPLFCHFYFDAVIWKSKHPDAKTIYSGYTRYTDT